MKNITMIFEKCTSHLFRTIFSSSFFSFWTNVYYTFYCECRWAENGVGFLLQQQQQQQHWNRKKISIVFFRNIRIRLWLKAHCHTRFQRAFNACPCVFKEITLSSKQRNYFENANVCCKSVKNPCRNLA